jgi:hypothetical protein
LEAAGMNFKWDDEKWVEGDAPTPRGLLDFVREHPGVFFVISVGAFVAVAAYGGKMVTWFINLIMG